jgi:hypothetical protein
MQGGGRAELKKCTIRLLREEKLEKEPSREGSEGGRGTKESGERKKAEGKGGRERNTSGREKTFISASLFTFPCCTM